MEGPPGTAGIALRAISTNNPTTLRLRDCRDLAGNPFCGHVPKLSISFEEIRSRAFGNFVEQIRVLESFIIIIHY